MGDMKPIITLPDGDSRNVRKAESGNILKSAIIPL